MATTGLVLQGGGAAGAFEYGVLRRLYEEPGFVPDVISGVSIGAINAACLVGARGDPLDALGEVWRRFRVAGLPGLPPAVEKFASLFGNPAFYAMRLDYPVAPWWTSFYTTDRLRALLDELVDFDKLNASAINLLIGATNVRTGDIEVFDNRRTVITADHVVASGSLPPGFPMTRIGEERYWDGGLFNNTPLAEVIERLDSDPSVSKRLFVVNLFRNAGQVPRNMLEVAERMFEIIFSNKLMMDVETARKIDEFLMALAEIDRSLPEESRRRIRALPGYQRLQQYKIVKNVIVIENRETGVVFGASDFSPRSIEARIRAGYAAADEKLRTSGVVTGAASAA